MEFAVGEMPALERYKLLTGLVVPRPIAFVSTVSADGVRNAAPFSFFNMFGADPPVVVVGMNMRETGPKDSYRNILDTGEFVINTATDTLAQRMNVCSGDHAPAVDEFVVSGLTPRPSAVVKPPGIAESPANLECKLRNTVPVGAGFNLIIAEIVHVHVVDDLLSGGKVDQARLGAIGRMGGPLYSRSTDLFRMMRPGAEA